MRKGYDDTSTRSGMLWEVERILKELKETNSLPQILVMENVIQVHNNQNRKNWVKWLNSLSELGYSNTYKDLIATDYGIPQTRNRTFLVSILGNYSYDFPKPIPLKLRLKDLLEKEVDNKYYLSDKMISCFMKDNDKYPRRERFLQTLEKTNYGIAATITTRAGERATDNFIKINNNNNKGFQEAFDGDGIDLTQPTSTTRRGRVQRNKIQTLTTQNNLGVICLGNYMPSNHESSKVIDVEGLAPTFKENHGTINAIVEKPKVVGGIGKKDSNNNAQWKQQNRVYDDKKSIALTTCFNPYYLNGIKIRKITPLEAFRLMGVSDEDFYKCAKNQSDLNLFHLAGDSIVVDVLYYLFKQFL